MKTEQEQITGMYNIVENLSDIISNTKDISQESLKKILENEKILTDLLQQKKSNDDYQIDCDAIMEVTRSLVDLIVLQKEMNKGNIDKLENEYAKTQEINQQLVQENEFLLRDQLTKLGNRHLFRKEITPYINDILEKKENISNLTFTIIDIDDFKSINDTYGHIIGDAVLKYFAKFITQNIEDENTYIYRFGGEEFIIIGINTPKILMIQKLRRLLEKLKETLITNNKSKLDKEIEIKLSFSGGMAELAPNDGFLSELENRKPFEKDKDGDTIFDVIIDYLYDIADKKLYHIKNNGKGNIL